MSASYETLRDQVAALEPFHDPYDLVARVMERHPTHWEDTAQALLASGTGLRITREQHVGRLWRIVAENTTLDQSDWDKGARALLMALGGGRYNEHAINAACRVMTAADETLRWLPMAMMYCQDTGGQAAVENFWRDNGRRILAVVLAEEPIGNLDTFLAYAEANGPAMGLEGQEGWGEIWLDLHLNELGGERDGWILERLTEWGVSLERASRDYRTVLEMAIEQCVDRDISIDLFQETVNQLLTCGAHWHVLKDTPVEVPAMVWQWVKDHPTTRKALLEQLVNSEPTGASKLRM